MLILAEKKTGQWEEHEEDPFLFEEGLLEEEEGNPLWLDQHLECKLPLIQFQVMLSHRHLTQMTSLRNQQKDLKISSSKVKWHHQENDHLCIILQKELFKEHNHLLRWMLRDLIKIFLKKSRYKIRKKRNRSKEEKIEEEMLPHLLIDQYLPLHKSLLRKKQLYLLHKNHKYRETVHLHKQLKIKHNQNPWTLHKLKEKFPHQKLKKFSDLRLWKIDQKLLNLNEYKKNRLNEVGDLKMLTQTLTIKLEIRAFHRDSEHIFQLS